MRLPRDLTGQQLVAALAKLGYRVTRQSGSHIRMTTDEKGMHHLTIPDHRPIKVGTLSAILRDVEHHHGLGREDLLTRLF
jgi:predicted RNA binding protein YcfA (HicA-like mRNA interferase family)